MFACSHVRMFVRQQRRIGDERPADTPALSDPFPPSPSPKCEKTSEIKQRNFSEFFYIQKMLELITK